MPGVSRRALCSRTTAGYTPEQNGVAERFNRTIVERVRVLLAESGLGDTMWGECMRYAVHMYNLTVKGGNKVTRFESFFAQAPDLSQLHPFGCVAWVHVPKVQRSKLQAKAVKGVLVGYEPPFGSRAYRVLVGGGKVVVSCDVTFPA